MTDRLVVVVAIAAIVGAWVAAPVPGLVAGGAILVALVARRPWLVALAVLVLASFLGARSWSGLTPLEPAPFEGRVTLVSDPESAFGAVRVEVRADGHRVEAWVRGAGAGRLRSLLAGERVDVRGRLRPPPADAPWLVPRHVVGQLDVERVGENHPADPMSRLANGLRRTLHHGADGLAEQERALFTGLVFGDDREQDELTEDDFRGAGLTHLLAVSGQNVAFVLGLVAPVTGRLGWRARLIAVLGVLAFFALATRFEPSVLRATVMAGIATGATTWGRPVSGVRLLALAVTLLVLVDPLLVHSVGFRLSVGASLGIALVARPLAEALPGPAPVRSVVAVTLAAQLGVAPVLLPVFGGIPAVSLAANVLAAPAAGLVMVWGLTAGVLAGLVGGPVADLLHRPTAVAVGWIASVARESTALRLGDLGAVHVAVLAGTLAGWTALRRRVRPAAVACIVLSAAVALHPAVVLRQPAAPEVVLGPGATLHRGRVLVVDGEVSSGRLLEALRRQRGVRLALVVTESGGERAAEAVAIVRRRYGPVRAVGPPGHQVRGASAPAPPWVMSIDGLTVAAEPDDDGDGLVVHVR